MKVFLNLVQWPADDWWDWIVSIETKSGFAVIAEGRTKRRYDSVKVLRRYSNYFREVSFGGNFV